ncbi:MAG: DUF3795 domain-containing protein [Syntrophomonadaceae bacterium]|nr:DUF3795 domain-containing protein [Syntrophomonadaceae bacterium]
MIQYKRKYPIFSLCGLNCGLCPRYHTDGSSKCPGCGGPDFHLKHPACSVITCNRKHDQVEFCFECSAYPCSKYANPGNLDSFISYRNVINDFEKARTEGVDQYIRQLREKIKILEFLISNYNDGRRKNFYCLAVNLLKLEDIQNIMAQIGQEIGEQNIPMKDKINRIVSLFEDQARKDNLSLKLRK